MTLEATRREFLKTTVLSTALGATDGAGRMGIAFSANESNRLHDPIRIKKIFLAKPVPTWPTPHLDVEQEIRKLNRILDDLKDSIPDIAFEGGELLRVIEDVPKIKESLTEVDGVLLFNLTSTVGHLVKAVVDSGKPVILFSQPYSGHDWSNVADLQKEGKKIEVIASSDYRDIVAGMRPLRTVKRLSQSKILVLRQAEPDEEKESLRWGTRIVPLQHQQLMEAYNTVDEKEATAETDRWTQGALKIIEPSRDEILRSSKFYLAMKKVMETEKAQAIAVNCLGLFYAKKLPAYPCLGFSRLNSTGFVGACEADVDSAFTMLLFHYLTGKPGFISDPVIDTSNNTVIHAHCVAPIRMDSIEGHDEPYILRSHLEDDKGAAVQVKMRVGQIITMAKMVGSDPLLFSTGKIIDNPESERGCRTKITTQVEDADKLLHQYSHGLHRVIFYGDHRRDIERLSKLMGFKVVYEM